MEIGNPRQGRLIMVSKRGAVVLGDCVEQLPKVVQADWVVPGVVPGSTDADVLSFKVGIVVEKGSLVDVVGSPGDVLPFLDVLETVLVAT